MNWQKAGQIASWMPSTVEKDAAKLHYTLTCLMWLYVVQNANFANIPIDDWTKHCKFTSEK